MMADELVLEAEDRLMAARIALASTSTVELSVDSPGIVKFRCDNMKSSSLNYIRLQTNIRSPPGHVCSDRYARGLTGFRYDLRFCLVVTGVEHAVREPGGFEKAAEMFGT